MRTCASCKVPKALTEFNCKSGNKRHYSCRQCTREKSRQYYLKNKDKVLQANKAWRLANSEKMNEYKSHWREKNRDKDRKSKSKWRKRNLDKVAEFQGRRRARELQSFVEPIIPKVVWERDNGECKICNLPIEGKFHLDHIKPLALGGTHEYANVQLAHPHCNYSKGASYE